MRLFVCFLSVAAITAIALAGPSTIGGPTYQGDTLTAVLPASEHIRNIGSRVDGAGMCVMSSIEMAARWAGLEKYRGIRDWCARFNGGSYPGKVDEQIKAYCKEKGLPAPRYLQYEGPDPAPLLKLIDKTGRMACVTYAYGPRYPRRIAHMVCCPRFGDEHAAILDNNFPGENSYEWMTPGEAVARIKGGSQGWVFVWLAPPPPPAPIN